MIITTVTGDWSCLVRRGMLYSETESVDWQSISDTLRVSAEHMVEAAVIVLTGSVTAQVGDQTYELVAGQALLVQHGCDAVLTGAATLLTVRAMPSAVSSALPPRIPELVNP